MAEAGHITSCFAVPGTHLFAAAEQQLASVHGFARQPRVVPFRAARRMARALKAEDVEVLWVRDPRDLAFAGMAAERAGIPLIFQQGMQIARPKKALWHRLRYARVARWVAPSRAMAAQAIAHTPLTADRVATIPLALSNDWFSPADANARQLYGWSPDQKLVGLFGRLDPLKGQAELLRAVATAPDLHVWFIGESTVNEAGDYRTELMNLAKTLGIWDRVRFDPPTEQLRSAYDALDCFAMCSASETFGMVTLEALARGIAVVGTQSGGTPELLAGQPGTALYPPGDLTALKAALERLTQQPGTYTRDLSEHTQAGAVAAWNRLLAEL